MSTDTVPVTVCFPVRLLAEIKAEAARRGLPYQRLLRDLVELGLSVSRVSTFEEMRSWAPLGEPLTGQEAAALIRAERDSRS